MNEADQQILTAAVLSEVGSGVPMLWIHYLSIGGSDSEDAIAAYIDGQGVLPVKERDLLSQALNELVMDSPLSLQAPCSDTPLALEPGS
ncbi:hypothetical protein [Arthrobacter crystallopoietes]|uniref:Uncharacterized protein n=1 Tax=Crystallibacter crystallopoietes TaxID=37928 RepID=A0A1H0ZTT2_9MICC|nr:hypothetical protein [Arthrobacter crystallopoietes]AUI51818.1 hypothetical protein AC20117_14500 [Arthrobacter crystallopoietes]SDQ30843.1 hypothetical protein SAMN04489742_0561 [Arthrobacter crystallopoietes]